MANPSTTDFAVSQGGVSGASRFLFDTLGGQILGWTPTVNATNAVVAVDNSAGGAVYTGLATANDRLYAADFHNARVDSFDASFKSLGLPFKDPNIPKGWAPFGIQALGGNIYVTYAQQDGSKKTAVPGGGNGYVDEFTPDGTLVARVASKGKPTAPLNAPWGLAMAPANFGAYSGDLLVGNFGNGRISAYQLRSTDNKWVYKGQVRVAERRTDRDRRPLGDRVRQRRLRRPDEQPVLRVRPERRDARPVRLHRRRLSASVRAAGGRRRLGRPPAARQLCPCDRASKPLPGACRV